MSFVIFSCSSSGFLYENAQQSCSNWFTEHPKLQHSFAISKNFKATVGSKKTGQRGNFTFLHVIFLHIFLKKKYFFFKVKSKQTFFLFFLPNCTSLTRKWCLLQEKTWHRTQTTPCLNTTIPCIKNSKDAEPNAKKQTDHWIPRGIAQSKAASSISYST